MSITFNPDLHLFVEILLVLYAFGCAMRVGQGVLHQKKTQYYDLWSAADGVLGLVLVLVVLIA